MNVTHKSRQIGVNLTKAEKIVEHYRGRKGALIPLLQEVQNEYGYVPQEVIDLISKALDIYPVEIYGVLSFYAQFYTEPRGRHTVKVCQGTACYIMGGKDLLDHVRNKLAVSVDETTNDGVFTLETVACLGCCGMAPVVVVDEQFYGRCTVEKLDQILDRHILAENK